MDLPAAEVTIDPELKGLCRAGGVAAWLLLAYSLAHHGPDRRPRRAARDRATLVLSAPTALSMLPLGDRYAAATSEEARGPLLAAGEALLAADMWHSAGAFVGAVLLQAGALLVSVVMLRTRAFGRTTAWVGILTHGLDLVHVLLGPFVPRAGFLFKALAGPLYLLWFPLCGRRLVQLGRRAKP